MSHTKKNVDVYSKCNLFIHGISPKATKKQIREAFKNFGKIKEIRFPKNKDLGYSFIEFCDEGSAERALNHNSGLEIDGIPITLNRSSRKPDIMKRRLLEKEYKVFIGNLPDEVTERDIIAHFSQFGEVNSVKIMINNRTKLSRGFGFVLFQNKISASRAVKSDNILTWEDENGGLKTQKIDCKFYNYKKYKKEDLVKEKNFKEKKSKEKKSKEKIKKEKKSIFLAKKLRKLLKKLNPSCMSPDVSNAQPNTFMPSNIYKELPNFSNNHDLWLNASQKFTNFSNPEFFCQKEFLREKVPANFSKNSSEDYEKYSTWELRGDIREAHRINKRSQFTKHHFENWENCVLHPYPDHIFFHISFYQKKYGLNLDYPEQQQPNPLAIFKQNF